MATLFVIDGDASGLGRAAALLARDRRVVPFAADARGSDDIVDLLARHDAAGDALRFAARHPERIGAIVLESPPPAEHYAELLPKLPMPVLVLYGTRDQATSPDLGRGYKSKLPNGWFVMVYNAGHDIANDRPEAYAELVGDFLKRGVRFTISEHSSRLNP